MNSATIRNTCAWLVISASLIAPASASEGGTKICSQRDGDWSAASTWDGGLVPGAGSRVLIRAGHSVTYDVSSDQAIRVIHVAGTLRFATDLSTRLDVGLIRIQPGDNISEHGFDCDAHLEAMPSGLAKPALLVGTPDRPVAPGVTARIRLVPFDGANADSSPAIVCCGGRMEFHGASMSRTWVKLGNSVRKGDTTVFLAEPVTGWRVGDRVILTATQRDGRERGTLRPRAKSKSRRGFTEERLIVAINDRYLTVDQPLDQTHEVRDAYRGEVANLSRNVVIESADPGRSRGHTMYHRGSAGSISYAEFRHLGKEGVLGKYSLHFHRVGDSMRGSSVVGASIWDSGNRWITIHGTDYLVIRDCVGYRSVGHGFYLEDGSETHNVLDRNLAVQAYAGRPLPGQFLESDRNEGAGFWWANSLNCFTRNVAVECDRYGYRFEATPRDSAPLLRPVLRGDGERREIDIRTLPFVRFQGNEAHSQLYGMNLGEGVGGIGPDAAHPFVVREAKVWDAFWAFQPGAPSMVIDGLDLFSSHYGIFQPAYDPRVRPYGRATVKGIRQPGALLASPTSIPGEKADPPVGIDDRPPMTVITRVTTNSEGGVVVRGTAADDGVIRRVFVNGTMARAVAPNFLEWEAVLKDPHPASTSVSAFSEDAAGNIEKRIHVVPIH
jgi:hypothetical protein